MKTVVGVLRVLFAIPIILIISCIIIALLMLLELDSFDILDLWAFPFGMMLFLAAIFPLWIPFLIFFLVGGYKNNKKKIDQDLQRKK